MINRIVVMLAFLILLGYAGFVTLEGYRWKQVANNRGWRADVCYSWLAQPIAKDVNGKDVTRAAILDAIAKQSMK